MFSQDEIDAVLKDAQAAVAELAAATGATPVAKSAPAAPAPVAPPPSTPVRPTIAPAVPAAGNVTRILRMKVPLKVRLAHRRMRMSDIMQLTAGAILEFEHNVESELELLVNNKCVGTGEAVKIGENFGLKVRYIGDVRQRIATLTNGGRTAHVA